MHKTAHITLAGVFAFLWLFLPDVATNGRAEAADRALRLAHTDWSSSVASSNLVKAVLGEKLGIPCELVEVRADTMWAAVAEGRRDAMVSAWLPDTHAHYEREFGNRMVDLGPNLEGTKIGLVVPAVPLGRLAAGSGIRSKTYMEIDSIEGLKEHAAKLRHRIIGIEPEAGIMRKARGAMVAYGLTDFRLVESSEVSMIAELSHAVRHKKWIVITGWVPHWSFARWQLKFLEDPKNIFGDRGRIHTFVRRGLERDMPHAFKFLDRFAWEPEEMGQLMLWIQEEEGLFPYEMALRWIRAHPKRVSDWLE